MQRGRREVGRAAGCAWTPRRTCNETQLIGFGRPPVMDGAIRRTVLWPQEIFGSQQNCSAMADAYGTGFGPGLLTQPWPQLARTMFKSCPLTQPSRLRSARWQISQGRTALEQDGAGNADGDGAHGADEARGRRAGARTFRDPLADNPPSCRQRHAHSGQEPGHGQARPGRRKVSSHEPRKIGYGLAVIAVLSAARAAWSPRRVEHALQTQTQGATMSKGPLSKSDLIQLLVDKHATNLTRKDVKGIIEAVASIGHVELKKNGLFVVPGLVRMVVVKKPATKERKGINPFTKEPTVFKAKPARKVVKGRPVKAAKDAVA